ncbi:hypothetical protein PDJ95_25875 [Bacillus cereus]|nr:hypothetical protein [Bacillus cereus]
MKCYIKDPGGSKVISDLGGTGGSPSLLDPGNGGAGFKKEPGGHKMADPGGW